MKVKNIAVLLVSAVLLFGFGIWAVNSAANVEPPPSNIVSNPEPIPEPVSHPTVSLPRLVDYYENELDPSIPRIIVTARTFGKGYAVDYSLPYDAVLQTSELKKDLDYKQSWFMNLTNNFWSLPMLSDGEFETTPAHLTIYFTEPPTGDVSIVLRSISETSKPFGVAMQMLTMENDRNSDYYIGNNTKKLVAQNKEVSFDLWKSRALRASSTLPYLQGLQIKCNYDEKQVEYYVLFQTAYHSGDYFPDTDFSHLTPLTE